MDRTHHTGSVTRYWNRKTIERKARAEKVVRTAAAHHRGPAPKPPGFIHQPLPEEDQEDPEGLHPPKPLSVLTAAEREEVQKQKCRCMGLQACLRTSESSS